MSRFFADVVSLYFLYNILNSRQDETKPENKPGTFSNCQEILGGLRGGAVSVRGE
jgi:hypothetical protein